MLRGMAIQDDSGSQKMLKLFNGHHLPVDPADRFKAIFQEQPQWTLQALQPYIDDLQACTNVTILLTVVAKVSGSKRQLCSYALCAWRRAHWCVTLGSIMKASFIGWYPDRSCITA